APRAGPPRSTPRVPLEPSAQLARGHRTIPEKIERPTPRAIAEGLEDGVVLCIAGKHVMTV
ncbi:MAG: hypothetical protein ACKVZJ_03555, partial [Phycisphaerales bacterium]